MLTSPYFSVISDCTIMKLHHETYKKWGISVEISGNSWQDGCSYIPRIVVTEQLSIGFKDLEVVTDLSYPTPECCVQAGIIIAREFIDERAQ